MGEGGGGTGRRDELLNFSLVCLGVRMSTPYDFSFGLGVPPKFLTLFAERATRQDVMVDAYAPAETVKFDWVPLTQK